jgi:magnesium chelatase family protein
LVTILPPLTLEEALETTKIHSILGFPVRFWTASTSISRCRRPSSEITSERTGEASAQIRDRVVAARQRQHDRFWDKPKITCNARMGSRELKRYCELDQTTLELLKFAMTDLNLSARAYDRILKVARTIADLADADSITSEYVSEAIQYRSLDRQIWT